MDKEHSRFRISILAFALLAALAVPAMAQNPYEQAVKNAKPVSWLVVSQTFRGSMSQTSSFLAAFMNRIQSQGLGPYLAGPEIKPLEILHDNPDELGMIDIELAFPITQPVSVAPPLVVRTVSFPKAVFYTHQGAYSQLSGVHAQIDKAVLQVAPGSQTDWPVVLRLLTDPTVVPQSQTRTEMIVPLN